MSHMCIANLLRPEIEKLSEKARYLFRQLFDIQKKEDTARFTIDQILAMKQVFTEQLNKELEDDKG